MPTARQLLAAALLLLAVVTAPAPAHDGANRLAAVGSVEVLFPPWDDAESALVEALDAARSEVLVQAFLLSSRRISDHLIAASRRGVSVRILADARQHETMPTSLLDKLAQAGIPVWLETRYAHAHSKVMIIDVQATSPVVITGSYNFTRSAQRRNAENLLILRGNRELTERYASNWWRHQAEAGLLPPR